jgi:hypothetical protein
MANMDTPNKRRAILGLYPVPDGSLDSISDRFQMIELYGFNISALAISYLPPNFILDLATDSYILNLSIDDYILLMEDQTHDLKIH